MKTTKSNQINYEIKTGHLNKKFIHLTEVMPINDGKIVLSESELKELYNAVFS